jgi:hypothetical protein
MKNLSYYACIFLMGFMFTTVKAQDSSDESLGLPGDNLNLYAVMKLFQESETLESFENSLNDENTHINNLDLDGDGNIDYIRVEDNVDGDVHTIVLKDAITPHENQDIAVFTVQRFPNNQVQIQLIGDEELYGKDYIIEPNYEGDDTGATPNPGYTGNTGVVKRTTYVEVAAWPLVHFIFMPTYIVWRSPWYFGYYPSWWRPWRPYYWDYYYGYHYNYNHYYYGYYRHVNHYRYAQWNDRYYNSRRSHSQLVDQRLRQGRYQETYSRPGTRQEGVELYRNTHRGSTGSPGNYPSTRPGTDKSSGRDKADPATRMERSQPSQRPDVGKPSNHRDVNRDAENPRVKRSSGRQNVNKSASTPGVNKRGEQRSNRKAAERSGQNRKKDRQENSRSKTDKGRR